MTNVLILFLRSLLIRQCILLKKEKNDLYDDVSTVKQMSEKHLLAARFDLFQLEKYIDKINFAEKKSAIILNITNEYEWSYILNKLKLKVLNFS